MGSEQLHNRINYSRPPWWEPPSSLFSNLNKLPGKPHNKPYITKNILCFLRHWVTDINKQGDWLKSDDTPLSQEEFAYQQQQPSEYKKGSIAYQALQIKASCIWELDKIRISTPMSVVRDVQTAEIVADILWLPFPKETVQELQTLLGKIENAADNQEKIKYEQEIHEVQKKLPSRLAMEENLKTSRKDKKEIEKIKTWATKYLISDKNQESKLNVVSRHAKVFEKILSWSKETDVNYNILIGHRTGSSFFDALKSQKKTLDFEAKEYGPGTIISASMDEKGNFVDKRNKRFFEFAMDRYIPQMKEIEKNEDIWVSGDKSLIENQNIINTYLQNQLLSTLFVVKQDTEKEGLDVIVENMEKLLHSEHELISDHTLYLIIDNIDKIDSVQIRGILLKFLEDILGPKSRYDATKKIYIFKEIYKTANDKEHTKHEIYDNLRKSALYLLYKQDSLVLTKLGEYSNDPNIERECKSIEYETLGEKIQPAYKLYMRSGIWGKWTRKLGKKEERTARKTSSEHFWRFIDDIFKMDKATLQKAAIGRLRTILAETGLDKYFYTKANGIMGLIYRNRHPAKLSTQISIKEETRNEIVLLLKILDFKDMEDLDRIVALLLSSGKKEQIQEIIKTLEMRSNKKVDNVVDLIQIWSEEIIHLLGRKARMDILDYLIENGVTEAKEYRDLPSLPISNNLLVKLGELLRWPIKEQARWSLEEQLKVSNGIDLLDIGGDEIKKLMGGPRKLGKIWNLIIHEHAIYGEGDRFASHRFTNGHILQLSEELWGNPAQQLSKILSEIPIDAKQVGDMNPEEFYRALAPHKKRSIDVWVGTILGTKISQITKADLQNLAPRL